MVRIPYHAPLVGGAGIGVVRQLSIHIEHPTAAVVALPRSNTPASMSASKRRRRSFFLSDPVRPVGGVEDADGVDDARPSVLYAPTGP